MTNKKYRRPLTAQAVKLRLQKFAANLVLAILLGKFLPLHVLQFFVK